MVNKAMNTFMKNKFNHVLFELLDKKKRLESDDLTTHDEFEKAE